MTPLSWKGYLDARTMRRALWWERRLYFAAHPLAYPLALVLERCGPAVYVPGIGHVVNDPAIARRVLTDTEGFTKNGPGSAGELITQVMGDYAYLNLEGEEHHDLRVLLLDLFKPPAIAAIIDDVWRPPLDATVRLLSNGHRVDLVRLATILTGRTMRHLLGLDRLDDDQVCLEAFALGERLVRVVRLRNGPLSRETAERSRRRFLALTDEMAAAIPTAPAGSVIGRLRAAGRDEAQIRGVCAALLLTGTDTLAASLPRSAALVSDLGLWKDVREQAPRTEIIEECLRVMTPSPVMLRSVRHDTNISGHQFRAGRRVAVMTYHAVRGFSDGCSFRPGRDILQAAQGLAFGAGIHHCIGYALASAELDIWLERLADATPLQVRRRAPAHRVLIPRYRLLEVSASP